jgi:4a-hydroxytetrahydrobiopterin dehydratase
MMASLLTEKSCKSCEGSVLPLRGKELEEFHRQVRNWELIDQTRLVRDFKFADYARTLAFVNDVANLAQQENHHPEICFGYGHARVELWTHKIKGLSENDFILAAKTDRLLQERQDLEA